MKRFNYFLGLFMMMSLAGMSQVRDVSLNVAPTLEYTVWDSDLALTNAPMIGGRLGFGFGRFFEIRGTYMQSFPLKTNLKGLEDNMAHIVGEDWMNNNSLADQLKAQKVNVSRWGGELKANIGTKNVAPYIILGSGVNTLKYDYSLNDANAIVNDKEYKEKQIYVAAGLGVKFNLTDRLVMTLEGRNTMFNVDSTNIYLKPTNKAHTRAYNWSGAVGLEYYLGGRNPKEMSELDKAYLNTFTNGFRGVKFAIEPSAKYVNFDYDAVSKGTYFLGGYAGIDITDFIGVRGFYFQSTGDKLNLNFDKVLQMYGGNIIAYLNYATGVVPFITLGGGYIDVMDNDKFTTKFESNGFVYGSAGIDIPLFKSVMAYGSVGNMITTQKNEESLSSPSDLKHHLTYDFGLRFKLGNRTQSPERILAEKKKAMNAAHQAELDDAKANYDAKIAELNQKLDSAYAQGNVEEAVELMQEKKEAEATAVSKQEKTTVAATQSESNLVKLSANDLKVLVEEVMNTLDNKPQNAAPQYHYNEYYRSTNSINERIDMLERLFLMNYMPQAPAVVTPQNNAVNQELLNTLKELNLQLKKNNTVSEPNKQQ